MTKVQLWVQRFVEEQGGGGAPFEVGDIVRHPSGRSVQITSGRYWGEYGVSNFWSWQEVLAGDECGPVEHGYGWLLSAGSSVAR